MANTITIKDHSVELEKLYTFITPSVKSEEIQGLTHSCIDWSLIFSNLFEKEDFSIQNVLPLGNGKTKKTWALINENYQNIQNYSRVIKNLYTINQMIEEKRKISNSRVQLMHHKKNLKKYEQNSLISSKKELLEKLQEEHTILQTEFQMKKDEFHTYKIKLESLFSQRDGLSEKIKDSQLKQREIFRITNDITKEIDQYNPRIQTYLEKLDMLDPVKDKDDYNRIQDKLDTLKEQIVEPKQQIQNLLQRSKQTKSQLNQAKKTLKQVKKRISPFSLPYNENKVKFEDIRQQKETLELRIKDIKHDITNLITKLDANKNPGFDVEEDSFMRYTSVQEIDNRIDAGVEREKIIESKLKKVFKVKNESEIDELYAKKFRTVQGKLIEMKSHTVDFSIIKNQFNLLNKFKTYLNLLLEPIGVFVRAMPVFFQNGIEKNEEGAQGGYNSDMFFQIMKSKNEAIVKIEDLKRKDLAYFYLAYIVCQYVILDEVEMVIPLSAEYLPHIMTTSKTLAYITLTLEERLSQILSDEDFAQIKLVFILEKPLENLNVIKLI